MNDIMNNLPIPLIIMGILLIFIFLLLISRLSKGNKKNTQEPTTEQVKVKKDSKKIKEIPIQKTDQINDPAMIRMNLEEQTKFQPQPKIQNSISTETKETINQEKEKEEVELL